MTTELLKRAADALEAVLTAHRITVQAKAPDFVMQAEEQMRKIQDGADKADSALKEIRAALATREASAQDLTGDQISIISVAAWAEAFKQAGVCVGNGDVAHMLYPGIFARAIIKAAKGDKA